MTEAATAEYVKKLAPEDWRGYAHLHSRFSVCVVVQSPSPNRFFWSYVEWQAATDMLAALPPTITMSLVFHWSHGQQRCPDKVHC
jgi:hypothetical protein